MAYLPHIEIVLPIYNEVKNIPILVAQLDSALKQLEGKATASYLFINDGSKDGSRELLHTLHETRRDIRVIDLLHNFGHSAALACGMENFRGDIALVMDADLQDPPEALISMFEAWKNGAKTVVAERAERKEKTSFLFHTFHFLLRKSSRSLPPISFGTHSLLDRSVVERMKSLKERNRYFPGLVGFSSSDITPIRMDRHARQHGKSQVGFWGLINLAVTAFLSFSNVPIRVVSALGIILSAASVCFGSYIIGVKLFTTRAIPGWASTMSLISFSTGTQLLCLGLIGEYVARIYDEVKERPLFLIERILEAKSQPQQEQKAA